MNKNETQCILFIEFNCIGFVLLISEDFCGLLLLQWLLINIYIFNFLICKSALSSLGVATTNASLLFFNKTAFPRQNPGGVCCGRLNIIVEENI